MRKYKIIARLRINMGRPVTDYDLIAMDCYHESPAFYDDPRRYPIEIVEEAMERYFTDVSWYNHIDSVELVCVA